MRRPVGAHLVPRLASSLALLALGAAVACGGSGPAPAVARSTVERANGRAYDGAPPTIPHDAGIGACVTCHDGDGMVIAGVGIAPASPHGEAAEGNMRRCRQCHVPTAVRELFVASRFTGLPQGPWKGGRATPGAPPTIPHTLQLRERCATCHDGPAARVEIRTTHPERIRCRQCHVPGIV
jgi:cytochrome c-type protein NapB